MYSSGTYTVAVLAPASTFSTVRSMTVGTWKSTLKFLNVTFRLLMAANVVILPWNTKSEPWPSTVMFFVSSSRMPIFLSL